MVRRLFVSTEIRLPRSEWWNNQNSFHIVKTSILFAFLGSFSSCFCEAKESPMLREMILRAQGPIPIGDIEIAYQAAMWHLSPPLVALNTLKLLTRVVTLKGDMVNPKLRLSHLRTEFFGVREASFAVSISWVPFKNTPANTHCFACNATNDFSHLHRKELGGSSFFFGTVSRSFWQSCQWNPWRVFHFACLFLASETTRAQHLEKLFERFSKKKCWENFKRKIHLRWKSWNRKFLRVEKMDKFEAIHGPQVGCNSVRQMNDVWSDCDI